jgi:MFS family permease
MTDRTTVPEKAGAESPPRFSDFNRLWLGQTISVFGTQITMLAMSLTAVVYLDAKASEVGVLAAARELAFVGLMLFAGVFVDRHRRRPVMIVSDLGRAAIVFAVPLLAWAGVLAMPHLYAAAFLLGALAVVFSLAYRAYLPTLMTSDALLVANSRLQTTESLAEVAGPSLAGLLVQLVTAPFALIADGVSFLASAWSIAAIRAKEPEVVPDQPAEAGFVTGVIADIRAGLMFTFHQPVLRLLAVASAIFNVFATIMLTIFVVYAVRSAELSAGQIGVVMSGFGVGGVIAAASLTWTMRIGVGRLLAVSYVVGAAKIVALPFVGGGPVTRTVLLTILFFIAGCAVVSATVVEMTIRQAVTPNAMQARVAAAFGFLIGGLTPVAAVAAGVLGDWIGPHSTLVVAAIGVPASLPWVLAGRIRRIRSIDEAG